MNRDDFAERALEIVKENKSNYTDDFQKWKEKGHLQEYEDEADMREKLSTRFQEQGMIENERRLFDIMYWKLQPNHYTSNKNSLKEKHTEKDIQRITAKAFAIDKPELSIEALNQLKGVREPTASSILMFYKPNKYTVLDQHAWRAARELGMTGEDKDKNYTPEEYVRYNNWCYRIKHDINEKGEVITLRQLDIALHSLGKDLN